MEPPVDKRKDARKPLVLRVQYKRLETFLADYTRNFSKGGAFIRTENPLSVGTRCTFCFEVPGRGAVFELLGEVIWVNRATRIENSDVHDLGMGIRFVFENPNDRIAFQEVVELLMADEAE